VSETGEEPIVVRHDEMPETRFPGVVRWQAFDETITPMPRTTRSGSARRATNRASGRAGTFIPAYVTYGYELTGRLRVEYGPGGAKSIEAGPGDFVRIPPGIVHREGSLGDTQRTGIGVRIGHGPLVVAVEGPDPLEDTAEDPTGDTAER